MAFYRYRIQLQSPLGTPLRSDTLMGQLLWAAALKDGPEAVSELIKQLDSESPPFIVSSAFPAGMLPMPVIPQYSSKRSPLATSYEYAHLAKQFKKLKWISLEAWQATRDALSALNLFRRWCDHPEDFLEQDFKTFIEPHNTIDRRTGTVLSEGGLFFAENLVLEDGPGLDIYVWTRDIERFERYLELVSQQGYGKDTSIGRGQFVFERGQGFEQELFDFDADQHMMLSVFSASNLAGLDGYYKPFVKRGRVWGWMGGQTPFKRPILAFEEGSVFSSYPSSGYVLRDIHADSRIVQVMWPMSLPCTLEEA